MAGGAWGNNPRGPFATGSPALPDLDHDPAASVTVGPARLQVGSRSIERMARRSLAWLRPKISGWSADHLVSCRKCKLLYNRPNFSSISKICNFCVYFFIAPPSLVYRMAGDMGSYRKYATRQKWAGRRSGPTEFFSDSSQLSAFELGGLDRPPALSSADASQQPDRITNVLDSNRQSLKASPMSRTAS
jgi:hypothetical protein